MYRFIENIGDFFTPGYYTEDFISKVISLSGYDNDAIKEFNSRFVHLKSEYFDFKSKVKDQRLHSKYIIQETHDFNTKLMNALGYDTTPKYANWIYVDEGSVIPARSVLRNGSQARLVVLEMQAMIKANEDDVPPGLFEQQYDDTETKTVKEQKYVYSQWSEVIAHELPEGCKISPTRINDCVTAIFRLDKEQRPQYVVVFAGNCIFVLEQDKWDHGAYVKFDLEELFSEANVSANRNYYSLFYLLASKEALAGDAQIVLMDRISEESFKNAYEVTKDLKKGVISAVEKLANEAIYYKREILKEDFNENDEGFASDVKDDCLTIIYRLLFIFYAEARPEIGILPMDDPTYAKGYSLDILRDLEQTPLRSQQSQNSYFFNDSLWTLFRLICDGHKDVQTNTFMSFSVKKIDSPLFDDSTLKQLGGVKFRNKVWQDIICSLSLSEEQNRRSRGRISYANLGVNQLGSVYESLLAYRGFYAEEDYIEVHPVGDTVETYLVPRRRKDDFKDEEILMDANDQMVILPRGKFVYRLNGRDRKKSASYYTPEVLTKSTVKYTLKGFVEKLDSGEMKAEDLLKLKILEPAMGAAAFQNEVINQLAELYLTYRQKERGQHISPHLYRDELQKVKAYIATKNIYGVDLNPTAIELGKLSLWLNVIHKDMETPFFGHRIALGNAVIGAWFKAYDENELCKVERTKLVNTEWWTRAPHLLHFSKDAKKIKRKPGEIYHFLVPDKNMLAALNIKEEKAAHPAEATRMKQKIADWTRPITKEDMLMLRKLSAKIDILIKECVLHQQKIDYLTQNRYAIWGHTDRSYDNYIIDAFNDKQSLADSRNQKGNAFFKLRTVMDYWCSLWFWEYTDALLIPSRTDYWLDIAQILGVDFSSRSTDYAPATLFEEPNLFSPSGEEDPTLSSTEEIIEEDIPTYTKEDAEAELRKVRTETQLFDNGYRIPVVQRLANRYHFFHPMLEFIEVFWLRDGFDVICGNPPWVNIDFDEQGIMSEKFPEVCIREASAPEIKAKRELFLQDSQVRALFYHEMEDTICSSIFTGSKSNYPLLEGQRTNLFKSIVENCFNLITNSGFIGLLHPESTYLDPKALAFRKEVYKRLKYHFQYVNELRLFAEVHHCTVFGTHIYSGLNDNVSFDSIHNLFHPSTIDGCYAHDGEGTCPGLKEDGAWCTKAHKERIVHITENELQVLSNTFESGSDWSTVKLVGIHSQSILNVLRCLSLISTTIKDKSYFVTQGLNETIEVSKGVMKRNTKIPDINAYEFIYGGPSIFVSNPSYKTPRKECVVNLDYDTLDFQQHNSIIRTNYTPTISIVQYKSYIQAPQIITNDREWIDCYKLGFRKMIALSTERSLIGAILPPKASHTGGIISLTFKSYDELLEVCGLTSSIVLDFYIKTIGATNLYEDRMMSFPVDNREPFKSAIISRTLLLNCVNSMYEELWNNTFSSATFIPWSIHDNRLLDLSNLRSNWNEQSYLTNWFERRHALIELDTLTAMSLGLSIEDLCTIYCIQFPVLKQNEEDTWYDQKGNIVFTCSVGLKGVGVDRPIWEHIRNQKEGETYIHTIDPAKSELYGGHQVTYYAPYNKCDRIEDYRRAWAHFEKIFNEDNRE